ncbi:MAG: 50S ribosomal protein L3 [Gammaproteobacteria bacterium]
MTLGLIGTKVGMTQIFGERGERVPVTVIAVGGNRIAQQKTAERDGYDALQIAYGERKVKRLTASLRGHLAKHQAGAASIIREFRDAKLPESKDGEDKGESATSADGANGIDGMEIGADLFAIGDRVDVQATSKGKGFAGVIKRWHFSANRATHGNSRAHRKPGSTGQCQDPGRVFPGKKMPGRLGGKTRTIQNLTIARVDAGRNLLLIRGGIPGAPGGFVTVRPSVKRKTQKQQ